MEIKNIKERFKSRSAIMLMLIRKTDNKEEILLQKRQNTGYMDGYWDFSATGHVEENEPMTISVIREAKEELNIDIKVEDLEFFTLIHKLSNGHIYYNGYFKTEKWENEPKVNEIKKCEEIKWFNIENLPENVINDRKIALNNYKNKTYYAEFGW